MSSVAVIGGSGFIGSHVVDKLAVKGHDVTVYDIMKPHRDDVRHIHIDVLDPQKTAVALTGEYDAIYMLAAMANVNDVHNNPVEASRLNVQAVANVLEAARRNDVGRVVLASTVWVYNLATEVDVDETTSLSLANCDHVYTATKVAAELYCQSYAKLYGTKFTVLRYGIPYGPRGRMGTVLATFVKKAMNGEALTIQGDGQQGRRFVYVEDLAEGNVAALAPHAANQTYNLDGLRQVSIREVAETVQRHFPATQVTFTESRPGDYVGKNVSSARAEKDLGWKARTDFQEGARRYIDWVRSLKQ